MAASSVNAPGPLNGRLRRYEMDSKPPAGGMSLHFPVSPKLFLAEPQGPLRTAGNPMTLYSDWLHQHLWTEFKDLRGKTHYWLLSGGEVEVVVADDVGVHHVMIRELPGLMQASTNEVMFNSSWRSLGANTLCTIDRRDPVRWDNEKDTLRRTRNLGRVCDHHLRHAG